MSHSCMSAWLCVFSWLVCEVWSGERAALAKAPTCLSVTASDRDGCVSLFSRRPDWPHSAASALISGLSLWLMVTLQMGHFPHMAPLKRTAQCEALTSPPHLPWNHNAQTEHIQEWNRVIVYSFYCTLWIKTPQKHMVLLSLIAANQVHKMLIKVFHKDQYEVLCYLLYTWIIFTFQLISTMFN